VNGTQFTKGFHAAPGTYSAYANFTTGGVTYTDLTRVTVAADGAVSPALTVTAAGVALQGTFTNASGARVALNTTVTLVGPGGAVATALSNSGAFSLELPPFSTYQVLAQATLLTSGPNGSFYQSWTVAPGSRCTPSASAPACSVAVVPTTELVYLNGTLSSSGIPGLLAGTVELLGPYPSENVTTVSAPSGSFSLRVLPGSYSVYANSESGSAARAAFATVTALPSTTGLVALSLVPTWLDTISIGGPNGSLAGLGPVTLSLRDAFGNALVFAGLAPASNVTLALPAGTYVVRGEALGSLNGLPATASGSATVTVVNGNVATLVPLEYVPLASVQGTLVGPSTVTLHAGGVASFAFTVRATGNVPVTIHPVGTPAYWTFSFSFASARLTPGPTGTNLSAQVTVQVPAGTPVAHPGVTIEFELSNGTVVGSVAPAPAIQVLPYYGVKVGSSPTEVSQVGPAHVLLPFYAVNTGNAYESVLFTVVDAPRLASLGWSATVPGAQNQGPGMASFSAGLNQTLYVELNATGRVFLAPGSVTVSASVLNASGSIAATATILVPFGTVHPTTPPGGATVVVTGPSIGPAPSSLPDWLVPLLVFVPAIGLVIGVISYRWWRTRRWQRR
jgi:hypothetical protein